MQSELHFQFIILSFRSKGLVCNVEVYGGHEKFENRTEGLPIRKHRFLMIFIESL